MSDNVEKLKKFKALAQQDELTEQELEKKQIKKLGEILEDTDKIRYVYIKNLDCRIPYKELPVTTLPDINKKDKTNEELTIDIIYLLLHAADPKVTKKQVEKMPLTAATELIAKTVGTSFLPGD